MHSRQSSTFYDPTMPSRNAEPKSRSEAERKRRSSGNHPILDLRASKQAMERGCIDTPRLYLLLTQGNVVGANILRSLWTLKGRHNKTTYISRYGNSILRSLAHNEGYCVTFDNARRRSKPRRALARILFYVTSVCIRVFMRKLEANLVL